ncbi:hypothetical protein YYC_04308 [Plasmodium yoelii 17X]|uniref:Fam-b protein n=4 Tax=Plasmodium yoelii TaxID=5861 RepID=A0AAF0AZV5_PLAYO|nr:fam-b protein [Plasmodium yoelii]EAA18084.1 hypothetical protein [Plasmodium yoelii yoelii]ETB57408.1 hypothetical protein YYC_04308 [Plasmodium yoelii 17X]WBY57087.1 fam-b protein [Plasmodium yoelii yoelii]CDU17787.1 fam-b protein [Plasmodium yoelii]VTZ78204.1 fam-b protein [Plasmodium yoelii]|eukprot:XP_726519.1 fam-b protein [Plasmodium yoelii]
MRVNILKYVFFSIVICSFEYAKNELYFANEREIYLERDLIKFRNNRTLSDADNQFDLGDIYQSTLSLVYQFNDCNDDEEITKLRNIIDSQIKNHKENNTLPNLNNVDNKTKKLIDKLQKELEVKKEHGNKRNGKLAIQPIHDKKKVKKDENSFLSECKDFKQLKNNEIALSNRDMKSKLTKKYRKEANKFILSRLSVLVVAFWLSLGGPSLMILCIPTIFPYITSFEDLIKIPIN